MPQILQFPRRRPMGLAQLMEPDREADEKLLRVIQGFEDRGKVVVFPSEQPEPFVSPYLLRPLRTEQEVRALRSQSAKPHSVFEGILSWWRGK
jgi:hypothetical protein